MHGSAALPLLRGAAAMAGRGRAPLPPRLRALEAPLQRLLRGGLCGRAAGRPEVEQEGGTMSAKNQVLILAERISKKLVAEQTTARLALAFDAAILAAHEVFGMGPGRAAAFRDAYQ